MVDLHTHILFGIDDGAKTLEDSLALIDMEIEQGVSTIVCTPHFNPLNQDLSEFIALRDKNLSILLKAVIDSERPMTILSGAEIYYSSMLLEMDLNNLVIENTDYLLIELSTRFMPSNLLGQLSELQVMGYKPILAHIEKYEYFRDNPQLVIDLIHQGVLMQANSSSLIDKRYHKYLKAYFKHNWVHIIASDTHNVDNRKPTLKDGLQKCGKYANSKIANVINGNANLVVNNAMINYTLPTKFKRIFGIYC